jgi:CIC family chloride channel protein
VACCAAAFAIAFRATLSAVLGGVAQARDVVAAMRAMPWWLRLFLPAAGALVAGALAMLVARTRGGQGVSDVMEAVVIGRVHLSMRVTLLKSLASWVAIASGGSLGREGPLIQFGGAAGQFFGNTFRLDADQVRTVVAAGTAAGFAAAYNTPLAAILFVLEVVTGVVVLDAVVPALIATVIATAATRAVVGAGPIYGARVFTLHSSHELFAFAGLGVVAALGAQGFMKALAASEHGLGRVPLPWRSAFGGLLAGGAITFLPEVAGNGYEPLNWILDGSFAPTFIGGLLLAKCFATCASVSSGSPGGVFTPTLLLGGCIGFLYGTGLGALFGADVGPAGGYALVGMAAMSAATTHAPIMAAVMAFELSGDYAVVLPLVLATAVATLVSRQAGADSIYASELSRRGIRWELTLEGRRVVR